MERKILKLLFYKEYYSKIRNVLVPQDFSPIGQSLLKLIDSYYNKDDEAKHVDHEIILKAFESELDPKFRKDAKEIFDDILQEDISAPNLAEYVIQHKQQRIANELSVKLLANDKTTITKLINEYQSLDDKVNEVIDDSEVLNDVDATEAFAVFEVVNRIPIYPKSLNQILKGGALRGQNILVFGRPEIGKTLFVVNLMGSFLARGFRVLYLGNEDPCKNAILPRIITRLSGLSYDECTEAPRKAYELASRRGYSNLYMKDINPGTPHEIKQLVERYEPDILVVDQLRHIYCGNMSKVEQMERVALEARAIAKKNNILCVGTTQAGDSAEGKAVLDMSDVDFSNTGMQGAMDLIIGIGANEDMINRNQRMISLPKNKISGVHNFFPVQYHIHTNKVESL